VPTIEVPTANEKRDKKYKLAFYTCFYGANNNGAFKIPKIPSDTYDCYFFTNNLNLLNYIKKTKWRAIYDDKPIFNDVNLSAMQSKYVKSVPHQVSPLNNYDFTCYLDSKLKKLSETFIVTLIEEHCIRGSFALLLRQHEFLKDNVWNEYNESIKQERYKKESDRIQTYIHNQLKEGLSENTDKHCQTGLLIRNMNHPKIAEINETWHSHIQDCGIQCQVSFFFVKQKFSEYILPFSENPFTC